MVVYLYYWRNENAQFFTHARAVAQEPTLAASIRDVFGDGLQFPILILLAFPITCKTDWVWKAARFLFVSYASCLFIILVLSSQTRPAASVLIVAPMAIGMHRPLFAKAKHVVILCVAGFITVSLMQATRFIARDEIAAADDQFATTRKEFFSRGFNALIESPDDVRSISTRRATGNTLFLSGIMDSAEGKGPLYGEAFLNQASSLVPRFLWPEKPVYVSHQLMIESLYGMPLMDAPVTTVNEFYAEFGYMGVFLGHFAMGFVFGKLWRAFCASPSVGLLIVIAFLLAQLVNMENEFVLGSIATMRSALIVYVCYRIGLLYVARTEQHQPLSTVST
jgi:hypothetical protein